MSYEQQRVITTSGILKASAMLRSVEIINKLLPEAIRMQEIVAEAFERELAAQRRGIANVIRCHLNQKTQEWLRLADLVEQGLEISYPERLSDE